MATRTAGRSRSTPAAGTNTVAASSQFSSSRVDGTANRASTRRGSVEVMSVLQPAGAVVVVAAVPARFAATNFGSPISLLLIGFPPLSTLNLPSLTVRNQLQLVSGVFPKVS